jgi:hypothetical protein
MWYDYKRKIEYLRKRKETLSIISKDVAQVFFAVLAIESFNRDSISWITFIIGLLLSIMFWVFNIMSSKIN